MKKSEKERKDGGGKNFLGMTDQDWDDLFASMDTPATEKKEAALYHWHLYKNKETTRGIGRLNGVVEGHKRIADGTQIHTSAVLKIEIREEEGVVFVETENTFYRCALSSLDYKKQDLYPDLLENYRELKEKYQKDEEPLPETEEGTGLLLVKNHDESWFHGFCCFPEGGKPEKCEAYYKSSSDTDENVLIWDSRFGIEIRYSLIRDTLMFTRIRVGGRPFFIENMGKKTAVIAIGKERIEILPGERKEIALPKGGWEVEKVTVTADALHERIHE